MWCCGFGLNHRVKISISSLLNPVTRNKDRSQIGDDGRTINWRDINANFRHPHRKPKARMIPVVDSTPFEIPTVSMKFLSRLSCEEAELSRYPLIAAYISCKLVSLVKFQRPLFKRAFVLQEIYKRIYYVLCDIGCSSKLALSSVLYMLRIFPDGIPYSGIRDHNCVHLVVRLFLLGFQLGLAWFHDSCCTSKTWSKLMGLTKKNVIRLEQAALQVLGYTLFISPSAWNGFIEQIHEDCPLFLYPGDFENLRQLVRSSRVPVHIAGPEQRPRELAAIGTISQAEIEYHRLRISECAIRGKITVFPNQDTESSRIEVGTEEDYLFDVFDAAEELLLEELVESDQLLPLWPRFLPSTSTNADSKQSSTSLLPPQSYPSSSTRSSPPAPGTCLSPVIKIEEVEVELVWPSSPHNAVSVRDQRSEDPARRESLRELSASSCSAEPHPNSKPVLFSSTNSIAVAGRQSILAHSPTESFNASHSDSRYAVSQGISDMSPNSIIMHSTALPPPSRKGQSIPETETGSGRSRYKRFETPASPGEYHKISQEVADMLIDLETNSGVFSPSGRFPALASPVHHNTSQGVMEISLDSGVLQSTPLPTNVPSRTDARSPTTEYRSPGQFQSPDLSSQKRDETLTTDLDAPQLDLVTLPETRSSKQNTFFSSTSGAQLVNEDQVSSVPQTPPARLQSTVELSLFSLSPLSPLPSIYDDSDCEAEDDMAQPDELYRSYTGAHLDVQAGRSGPQVRFRTPDEGTQIEEEEDEGEEEVHYCDCSEYEDDGYDSDSEGSGYSHVSSYSSSTPTFDSPVSPHLSQLFSLSSLSPLSTTYNSDVEIDDAEEIDEEDRDSEDNFEDDSDVDSDCSYASSTSATSAFNPSVSPPPFKIPDTYDRETGLWIIPSPKSTEEELGSPGSRHLHQEERPFDFTSAAFTPDIKDEFYSMSHYGPIDLGQGGFADGGERAPSPHPLDLEAELIHREFLSFPPRDRLSSPAVVRINSMVQGALV
ncbi:MAG: hypothetical protein NXY57DRAFT_606642 [Lentinula lateritia]|nr:MAG: hypothetical protein NXY57DRAFT_606642 [Lentinula lateritia]